MMTDNVTEDRIVEKRFGKTCMYTVKKNSFSLVKTSEEYSENFYAFFPKTMTH